MISIARTLPCLLATLALIATPLAQAKVSPADQMLEAAQNFIKSLDEKAIEFIREFHKKQADELEASAEPAETAETAGIQES